MIRVGWLPALARLPGDSRPSRRRRTYTRRRVRSPRRGAANRSAPVNNEDIMIFDQAPAELPVATLIQRDGKSQLRADLYAWFAAKWRWFKPRTVPMIVAFIGMLAVVGSANWLRNYARRAPDRLVIEQTKRSALIVVDAAPAPPPAPSNTD